LLFLAHLSSLRWAIVIGLRPAYVLCLMFTISLIKTFSETYEWKFTKLGWLFLRWFPYKVPQRIPFHKELWLPLQVSVILLQIIGPFSKQFHWRILWWKFNKFVKRWYRNKTLPPWSEPVFSVCQIGEQTKFSRSNFILISQKWFFGGQLQSCSLKDDMTKITTDKSWPVCLIHLYAYKKLQQLFCYSF